MITFDLDGTLHMSGHALVPAVEMTLADMGAPSPGPEKIRSLFGEPMEKICHALTGDDSEMTCIRFLELLRIHQSRTIPALARLYPGTEEVLQSLRRMGCELAVCSNAHRDYIGQILEATGTTDCFNVISGADDGSSKTYRLEEISKSGERFTVMIGDRYHDVEAALQCSIPSVFCSYGFGAPGEEKGASFSVSDIRQVPACIGTILEESMML